MLSIKRVFHILLLITFLVGCNTNPLDVDVSHVSIEMPINRLEKQIQDYDFDKSEAYQENLLNQYGDFYNLYIQRVLQLGHVQDPALGYSIKEYLNDPVIAKMFDAVDSAFADLQVEESLIKEGFQHYKYYFPEAKLPLVATFVTNFNYNVVAADSALGIGLEMYLGSDNQFYKNIGMPEYRCATADRIYMPYDAVRGWVLSEFEGSMDGQDLLSLIIGYGKTMYLMDACFPNDQDYLKIRYTKDELNWCEMSEWSIWSAILDADILYNTDSDVIRAYTGEGPFTPGMPKESPSRIGLWLGWQVVRSYMKEHPDTSIPQLMRLTNAQEILQQSGYKPTK